MLINDDRQCAKEVNAILSVQPSLVERVVFDGQVIRLPKAYFFGHYDSRGGASMVLAKNHIEALKSYMSEFGMEEDAVDDAQDDFLFKVEVIFCGGDPDLTELDQEYDEDGFKYGRVQTRYLDPSTGTFSSWKDEDIVVFWKEEEPKLELRKLALDYDYRIERLSLGEDAFGLAQIS